MIAPIDLVGLLAGLLAATCFVPQVVQTVRTRRADDVSLWMLLLSIASGALYQVYAIALALWPVVVTNAIFLSLVLFELVLKIVFSRDAGA